MSDEKRLFDKSPDELREAFVRNRFGQTDVFGLAGIEEWLRIQRTAERPAEIFWQVFFTRNFAMCAATAPYTHLHERATRQDMRGEENEGPYWPVLFHLRGGLYLGYQTTGIFMPGGATEMFVLDSDEKGLLTMEHIDDRNPHVGANAVVDVLYAEWVRQRPKWRVARQFLCDALAEEVKRERARAEADFATAVAISADGTKIVHADWVVVMGECEHGDRTFHRDLRFPASAFLQRKILRTRPPRDEYDRRDEPYTLQMEPDPWDNAEWSLRRPRYTVQWLFESARAGDYPPPDGLGLTYARATGEARYRTPSAQRLLVCTDGRVLFVHRDSCPSPLPDGGVAVTA